MARRSRADDPATAYAKAVIAGKIIAGRLVRLACERHLRDLETGAARGLVFDREAAQRAIDFFEFLTLGDGSPFTLLPFQNFKTAILFGWYRTAGTRRFRTAYIEEGKGGGKTPWASATLLYLLVADGKHECECYCAAVTREQASIAFRDAKNIASRAAGMSKMLDIGTHNIAYLRTASFLRPISSEHRGLDGKRIHGAVIDEIHEHPSPLVADKISAGTKADLNALVIEITNSGYDRASICWHHREYSRNILEGRQEDDSWFAYVCTLDPCEKHLGEGKQQPVDGCPDCDDWHDESVWVKANPGLDAILPREYLRGRVTAADGMPSMEGIVKRLNFCLWTENVTSWLPSALWSRGATPIDLESLRGQPCWGGLDLASKLDVAALVLVFREERIVPAAAGEPTTKTPHVYRLLPFFWIPKQRAQEREFRDRVPYFLWESRGAIFFTEGEIIDYKEIERFITEELYGRYQIREIAYDPWNCQQTATNLAQFGIEMIEFGQSMRNFNEPSKEFEALLRDGRLIHGDHPVLNSHAANVEVRSDPSGNIRPVKPEPNASGKVDGIVASVMGLARAMIAVDGPSCSWI